MGSITIVTEFVIRIQLTYETSRNEELGLKRSRFSLLYFGFFERKIDANRVKLPSIFFSNRKPAVRVPQGTKLGL